MIPWEHLDTATLPDGGGDLRLMRRGAEYSIMSGAIELMNSRLSGSEEALATLPIARLTPTARGEARVLIGGLGMGFTLRAALAVLGPKARVTVAEIVPAVIAWARGPMAALHGASLDDPRVTVHAGDVVALIAKGSWDVVALDVDNGPEGLSRRGNDRLYDTPGLAAAKAALRPGGVLAVWSSSPHAAFAARLGRSGLKVEEVRVRANAKGKGGARHVVWLGVKG
jgi:spermidine synthase